MMKRQKTVINMGASLKYEYYYDEKSRKLVIKKNKKSINRIGRRVSKQEFRNLHNQAR